MKIRLILILIFFCTLNSNAHAYIDPGMGSILLQGIIAAIAATSLTIKIYWQKIKNFFKKKKKFFNK
jgi:hypothetical protein